jgi:excinuclease ABC subunit C
LVKADVIITKDEATAYKILLFKKMSMEKERALLLAHVKALPHLPGVYRMLNTAGDVLYVGKAIDLRKRVGSYFQKNDQSARIKLMLKQVSHIETTVTRSEAEALILENNLIKALTPRYNILFRDDKSYPYVALSGHPFPRLHYFRGTLNKKNTYFGPYPNAFVAKQSIEILQKTFQLRTCEDSIFHHRSRPCLLHQIKRCTAPCVGLISPEKYADSIANATAFMQGKAEELMEKLSQSMQASAQAWQFEEAAQYRDQIQSLNKLQERQYVSTQQTDLDVDVIACVANEGMVCVNLVMVRGGQQLGDKSLFPLQADTEDLTLVLEAFLMQHYLNKSIPGHIICSPPLATETLAKVFSEQAERKVTINTNPSGIRRVWLEMAQKNAYLAVSRRLGQKATQMARYQQLAEMFDLPEESGRIECFDISHTMGEATVASCVVYDHHSMQPKEYRHFNIKDITPGDDYAAMQQVLMRRYRKIAAGEGKMPDLVLIDGGKGQLQVAETVLSELGLGQILLVGVAKGETRKSGMEMLIVAGSKKTLQLASNSPALHLIQTIRDEAHRFAITGHRARRAKARTHSVLQDIPGIGVKRRQQLLTRFGGMQGLKAASIEELAKTAGVSHALASKIYESLHE